MQIRKFDSQLNKKKDKFEITSHGFLIAEAYLTRTGVFDYYKDNKLMRELRPEDEVFKQESLDTLKFAPITWEHPKDFVNADNIKKVDIGVVGENIVREGDLVKCTLQIRDKDAVRYILDQHKQGKSIELSCGYEAEVEPGEGHHDKDGLYNAVQKNIKYNHLSIVNKGRAGNKVKLKLDKKEFNMKKFRRKALTHLDVSAYNVDLPEEAIDIVKEFSSKLDDAENVLIEQDKNLKETTKKRDELQAKIDEYELKVKELQKKVDTLNDPKSEVVQKLLEERKTFDSILEKFKIEDSENKTLKDIKIEVIKTRHTDFNAEDKSDDYLDARFDAVVELANEVKKEDNKEEFKQALNSTKKVDKKSARELFIERNNQDKLFK